MPQSSPFRRTCLFAITTLPAALFAVLLAGPAVAQVFECAAERNSTFQAVPCDDRGRKLDLAVHQPTPVEQAAAKALARKELAFVQQTEAQRETASRQAATDRQRRNAEQELKATRCARYLADAERAEQDAGAHPRWNRYKRDHQRRARELRDRHFSECFATG